MLILVATSLLISMEAVAAEQPEWRKWPMGDKLVVTAGLFFPRLDTKVGARSADAAFPVASVIDFESDLGLDDHATRPVVSVRWRMARQHSLDFNYFQLDRDGSATTTIPIRFGDNVIDVGTPVYSFFDIEVFELSYAYSLVFTKKIDWSVGAGLSVQDIDMGIIEDYNNPILADVEAFSFVAPLPTLNMRLHYAFTDKWIGTLNFGWLAVEADLSESSDFSGSIWNSSFGVRYKAFKNVSFMATWSGMFVDVKYNKRDLRSEVDYKYNGLILGIQGYY